MTLTLQALLLLLLYLPGALFWAFLTDHASSFDYLPVVSPSYSVGAAYALILSIIFQGLGLILSPTVRTTVTDLLLLASSSQSSADSVRNFPLEHLTYLCFYFCILCLAAAMSGRFCQWVLIEQYHLDLRFDFLRFYPRWVYLFKGYDSPLPPTQQMVVAADLLTDVGGQLTLYSGFVTGYWFDETTRALDVIVLDEPTRQTVTLNQTSQPAVVPIDPSAAFAVKFGEVKNINLRYFDHFEDTQVSSTPASNSARPIAKPRSLSAISFLLILAVMSIWLFRISSRQNDLALELQKQKAVSSRILTIGQELHDATSELANLKTILDSIRIGAISIERPWVGRLHTTEPNRGVRFIFQLHNTGSSEARQVSLKIRVNGDGHKLTWAEPTPAPVGDRIEFSLAPSETVQMNAWTTPTTTVSRVEVFGGYFDGSGRKCFPIGFCRVYDRKSEISVPCPGWKLDELSGCQ